MIREPYTQRSSHHAAGVITRTAVKSRYPSENEGLPETPRPLKIDPAAQVTLIKNPLAVATAMDL